MFRDDICWNHHKGNPESILANEGKQSTKDNDRLRILTYLLDQGARGGTCDEAEQELGMSHQTCSARFSELKRVLEIHQIGRRPTRTGSLAGVYVTGPPLRRTRKRRRRFERSVPVK